MWREDAMMWLLTTPVHCRTCSRMCVCGGGGVEKVKVRCKEDKWRG